MPSGPQAQLAGRVLERRYSGIMTRVCPGCTAPATPICIHPRDAEARGHEHNDLARVSSRRGRVVARVETQWRNCTPRGCIFVPWFGESVFIDKGPLYATRPISRQEDFKRCAVKVEKA